MFAVSQDRLSLLIADDVADLRTLLRFRIETDHRFEIVGEASNGREAVDLAESLRPDLVLLDLAMPVMDGLEALPRIHDVSPGSRVLVVSGFDHGTVRDEALARSAYGYVVKGADMDEIVSALVEAARASEK